MSATSGSHRILLLFSLIQYKIIFGYTQEFGRSKGERSIWKVIWSAVNFSVWKKRNDVIFNLDSAVCSAMVQDIKFLAWSWLHFLVCSMK